MPREKHQRRHLPAAFAVHKLHRTTDRCMGGTSSGVVGNDSGRQIVGVTNAEGAA